VASKGLYKHYKGNFYQVIGLARHSETEEELVVYRAEKTPEDIWVRPRKMFEEDVEVNGETKPRFEKVN
jgi:hypothetical protein